MRRALGVLLRLAGIALVSVPLSVVATILLSPFWSWLEASTGIEAAGHSGPTEWCYAAVFVVAAALGAWIVFGRRRAGAD